MTLLLAALFVAEGVVRTANGRETPSRRRLGLVPRRAASQASLSEYLVSGWPAAAIWAIGLLLGINLIVSGTMNTVIALAGRPKKVPTEKAVST